MFKPGQHFGWRYWCYKNFCSIILLAVCDARGLFTYIDVGRPGSYGGAATFNLSSLCAAVSDRTALASLHTMEGQRLRPVLLADSAFPFLPTVMKHYDPPPPDNTKESLYNFGHMRGRCMIESAFGRLKGRWWILRFPRLHDPAFMRTLTVVCCYLHNFCELEKEVCDRDWRRGCRRVGDETDIAERVHPWPNPAAAAVLEALAAHMWNLHLHRHAGRV